MERPIAEAAVDADQAPLPSDPEGQARPEGDQPGGGASQPALLASIVESSDDAIMTKTLDGIITSWNPAAQRIYGYAAEEIIGRPVSLLIHADRPEEMVTILAKIRDGERADHYETTRIAKDGHPVRVSLTVSPLYDSSGCVVGASSIARDITERLRADEQIRAGAQYARSLIEASVDPLVTISPEGKITDVNDATVKVTGVGRDRLVGTDFSDYFTESDKAREGYRQVFAEGSVTDYPLTIRHADGRLTDVLYNASVYKDAAGNVLGVFAAARDVTERKGADEGVRRSEEKFRAYLESAPDATVVIDPEGHIVLANAMTETLFGYPRAELLGQPVEALLPESVRQAHVGHRVGYAADPQSRNMGAGLELLGRRRDGSQFPVDISLSPLVTEEGMLFCAAIRDVTAQKQASQYARSLIEASVDPLVTISPEGKITDVNDATIKVTGVGRDRLVGTDFSDYFTESDKAREGYRQVFAEGSVTDYPLTIRHADGRLTDVLYNASVYKDAAGNVLGVFAAARDVTAQKQASQYARSLIEASVDPLVTISPEGKITDVNDATIKVTGVGRDRLVGTDFSDYFTESDKAREGYRQVFAEGSVTDYPLTIRHADGRLTDVLYNASVYKDAAGNVLGVFAAARDVTAQKQASQYARSLIEASVDPLVTISPEGKITDVNDATVKVTGVAREGLVGTDFSDYFTESDKAREGYRQVFAEGSVTDYPLTIRHADGRLTDVLYNASVYKDGAGAVLGVFAAARDVTAQKQAETEIATQRAKELERLAELERFQKLTVGRELKMIELKKEIVELKRLAPANGGE